MTNANVEVSVVLPCLNEAATLAACIDTIQSTFEDVGINGEILVADNGSTDRSQAIAAQRGVRLVRVAKRGYGSALQGGIAAAKGRFVIFGDADGSYDFREIPTFLSRLRGGDELVMGNRFTGKIHPHAMPWLHRYLGNPLLSGLGRWLFRVPVGDFHCGLRGFSKAAYERMQVRSTGMEFATEMVVQAALHGLRISEVPVELRPDGRDRPPHLNTWRDGWRHLWFMLRTAWKHSGGRHLLALACLLFVGVVLFSQIWRSGWCNDESAHIPAGLYHWETGRMDAYRVNPPLPRMLAALPLLADPPEMKWYSLTVPQARNEYAFAGDWIRGNLPNIPRQLRLARSTMVLFFLLGAWTVYRWALELYGQRAGWFALALWALSPTVITYSATVAPDLPAAATGLFACYLYWRYLKRGSDEIPWDVCFGVALATLSKFSWLFLFVLFPVVTLIHDFLICQSSSQGESREPAGGRLRVRVASRRVAKLSIALLGSVLIINLMYGFEGTGQRLGDFEFLSETLGGEHESRRATGNRFRESWLAVLPMPIPREMLQGLDYVKWEFEQGMPCYLLGESKFRGWWYFYLVAMAVKMPTGYLLLITLGSLLLVKGYLSKQAVRGEWFVPLVACLFIAQVSSQTGFTHHLRYVLPAFGFLFILAARTVRNLPAWGATALICLSLVGSVIYHAAHLGQAHAHFNMLAGGPENGWRFLSLSNLDWGQSTFRIANWARTHPDHRPLTVVFVSPLGGPSQLVDDLEVATAIRWKTRGANKDLLQPEAGWYLLSSEQLTHPQNEYFRQNKPESWPYADVALFYVSP